MRMHGTHLFHVIDRNDRPQQHMNKSHDEDGNRGLSHEHVSAALCVLASTRDRT